MLSLRLHELEVDGFITKRIVNKTPLRIEYSLTEQGYDLNRILYEINMYAARKHPDEVFVNACELDYTEFDEISRNGFKINQIYQEQ